MISALTGVASNPPWYVVVIISVVAGALASRYGSVVIYPLRRLQKDEHLGTWHECHWTWFENEKRLWRASLTISKGVFQRYVVRFVHGEQGEGSTARSLRYDGDLTFEGGHVILNLKGKGHVETLMYRFPDWLPSVQHVVGIWMSYDHSNIPAAGGAVLSRHRLSDKQVEQLLTGSISTTAGLLRVVGQRPGSVAVPN